MTNGTNIPPTQPVESSSRFNKWWLIIIILILVVVGVVFGISYYTRDTSTDTDTSNATQNVNGIIFPMDVHQPPDQDRDRLTDNEEATYGTDPLKSDTDGDSLSDYDEIAIYKTDPNDQDTDKDGHLDGDEVKDGFDPNGPGEILNINNSLSNQTPN
ncbi:hypothetical protein ACFL04_00600 [Patescibacteria group bacterium]